MPRPASLLNPSILTGLVIALAMLRPQTAAAQSWCLRDKTSDTPAVCGFSSGMDCAHAAAIGGPPATICERERWNPGKSANQGKSAAERSRAVRQQQADR